MAISENDVAIIGMACRLPGADSVSEFWRNLDQGVESITFFSPEDLLAAGVDPSLLNNPDYVRAAPLIRDFDCFDASFFGYSPREAALMEPQQRLFLQVAWETMEDAGYCPDRHQEVIGVYCGAGSVITSYLLAHAGHPAFSGQTAGVQHISNDKDFLSTRVSYKLNLTGPSLTVQTACSTSLVALHLACQGILNGECDMALAGASAIRVPHLSGYLVEKGNVHSTDGRCHSFDAGGTGTIFGSGVVAVLLKPLDRALADGDRIEAVVKGTAINNDGAEKVSYTAPSITGQARAMVEAMAAGGVAPGTIDYVECHATGTTVGDPLEIQALTRAFRTQTDARGFCGVGSVKSNIGHPEQAAGLAGLMKVALALQHRRIPATINCPNPNPNIPFGETPFYVVNQARDWPQSKTARRAGVNSLGIGGTNAFAVLEECPAAARDRLAEPDEGLQLFCLSAKNADDLTKRAAQFEQLLAAEPPPLADLCATTNRSRSQLKQRLVVVAGDCKELKTGLAPYSAGEQRSIRATDDPKVVFLFTGQGPQYLGMGQALYRTEGVYRESFDRCSALFEPSLAIPLSELVFEGRADAEVLRQTRYAQPALFALEYALAQLWMSFGVEPDAVMGHSLGELVAACVAGCFELPAAVELVSHRARLMQSAPSGGGMIAVMAAEDPVAEVLAEVGGEVRIAAINSPLNTVVSGERKALDRVQKRLEARDLKCQMLNVSHAFHSPMMDPVLDEFEALAAGITARPPNIACISNVSGGWFDSAPTAQYWREHIRRPVRFADGMKSLAALEPAVVIEIGPGRGSLALGRQTHTDRRVRWLASIEKDHDERRTFLESLGGAYCQGVPLDWDRVAAGPRRKVRLPTYPFERKRHWVEPVATVGAAVRAGGAARDPLIGTPRQTGSRSLDFEFPFGIEGSPKLADHRILGMPVLPTAAAIFLARRAGRYRFGRDLPGVSELAYHEALVLPESGAPRIRLTLSSESGGGVSFGIFSRSRDDEWRRHLSGRLRADADRETPSTPKGAAAGVLKACREQATRTLSADEFYGFLATRGLDYGPAFRAVERVWLGEGEAVWRLSPERPRFASGDDGEIIVLDAALHAYPLLVDAPEAGREIVLPVGFAELEWCGRPADAAWVHAQLKHSDAERQHLDIVVYDRAGEPLAWIESLELRKLPVSGLEHSAARIFEPWLYAPRWTPLEPLPEAPPADDAAPWLVIGDRDEYLQALVDELESLGRHCRVCEPAAVAGALDESMAWSGVVLFAKPSDPSPDVETLWAASQADLKAALELFATLGPRAGERQPRVWFASRGVHSVAGESASPAGASLWGFARTAALEYPRMRPACVDLDVRQTPGEAAAALCRELLGSCAEDQVALRAGDERFGRRLERLAANRPAAWTVRGDASYLITGGLGNLGLQVARWLVRHRGARSLVLTSRSAPGETARAAIASLQQMGCEVTVVGADIAVEEDVKRLFEQLRGLPPLRGIVHGAGVLADGIIARARWTEFSRALAPKIRGGWLLHQYSRELDLDFFVMQSSVLSLIGSAAQSNYTAANAFLDALAEHRRAQNLAAATINWGPWNDGGMARSSGARGEAIWKSRGMSYIDPHEGVRIFGQLLDHGVTQAAVTITDWGPFLANLGLAQPFYRSLQPATVAAPDGAETTVDLLARLAAEPAGSHQELILAAIRYEISDELGFEELIDPDQPLNELGLDSLMSVNLANRLERNLELAVPLVELIQGPSLKGLAAAIAQALPGRADPAPEPARVDQNPAPARGGNGAAAPAVIGGGDPWLVFPRPNPDARLRLVCFPFAGGGSMTYRPWVEHLAPEIELVAVEPPGRATRVREPPVRTLPDFLAQIVPALERLDDKPSVLFGHCLGGLNVFETARQLIERRSLEIRHIFVSGSRPPHQVSVPGKFEEDLLASMLQRPAYDPLLQLHEQPDEVFADIIRSFNIGATDDLLSHPELSRVLLPAIRADFEISHDYRPQPISPWPIPITCFIGVNDPYVSRQQSLGWSQYTCREFRLLFRESAHFMVVDDREFIVETINHQSIAPEGGGQRGSFEADVVMREELI